jgi:deoxyribonuclease-4
MTPTSDTKLPLLGTHVSVSGGLHTAYERGTRIGCTAMQIFVKNASQWAAKPLEEADIGKFREAAAASAIRPVIAHAAYLINLCAGNGEVLRKSRMAFEDELRRCEALGVHALVFHPGSHGGAGEERGIRCIADSLNEIHDRTKGFRVLTTLETTAGQGYALGYRFEHLRAPATPCRPRKAGRQP